MVHVRAHIRIKNADEAATFVSRLNKEFPIGSYYIENFDGSSSINARSILGVIYAMAEHNDEMFFVCRENEEVPFFVDEYRVM